MTKVLRGLRQVKTVICKETPLLHGEWESLPLKIKFRRRVWDAKVKRFQICYICGLQAVSAPFSSFLWVTCDFQNQLEESCSQHRPECKVKHSQGNNPNSPTSSAWTTSISNTTGRGLWVSKSLTVTGNHKKEGPTPFPCFGTKHFINPWENQDLWCRNKVCNSHPKGPQKGSNKSPNGLRQCQSRKHVSRISPDGIFRGNSSVLDLILVSNPAIRSALSLRSRHDSSLTRSLGCLVLHGEALPLVHLLPSCCSQSLTSRRRRGTKNHFLSKPSLFPLLR